MRRRDNIASQFRFGNRLSRYPDELHCHFILADDGETQVARRAGMDMTDEQRKGPSLLEGQGYCRVKSTQLNLLDYTTREMPVQSSRLKE
jgi:hypothetical protein